MTLRLTGSEQSPTGSERTSWFLASVGASRSSWRFDAGSWAQVARSHTNVKRSRLEDRKAIVDALIVAVDRIDENNAVVRTCDARRAAIEVLTANPQKRLSAPSNGVSATPSSPAWSPTPDELNTTSRAREGERGTTLAPARPAHTPSTDSSEKPLPDPDQR